MSESFFSKYKIFISWNEPYWRDSWDKCGTDDMKLMKILHLPASIMCNLFLYFILRWSLIEFYCVLLMIFFMSNGVSNTSNSYVQYIFLISNMFMNPCFLTQKSLKIVYSLYSLFLSINNVLCEYCRKIFCIAKILLILLLGISIWFAMYFLHRCLVFAHFIRKWLTIYFTYIFV